MGMCKGCGEVFPAIDINEGFCKNCDNEEIRNKVEIEGAKNTTTISLKKEDSIKNISVGFSFLFFIFGIFYSLVKMDIKNSFIYLAGILILVLLSQFVYPPIILLTPIFHMIMSSIYNKLYVKDLLKKGYLPLNKYSENTLKEKKLYTLEFS